MGYFKQTNIEHRSYFLFNDMINIKIFDPNLLSIDKIPFKSSYAIIYRIRYITLKNLVHVNIDSENFLYLIVNNVDGYNEEKNGNKYLIFASRDKNKEVLKNTQNLISY